MKKLVLTVAFGTAMLLAAHTPALAAVTHNVSKGYVACVNANSDSWDSWQDIVDDSNDCLAQFPVLLEFEDGTTQFDYGFGPQ